MTVLLAFFSLHPLACVRDTGNDPLERPHGPLMILNKTKPTFGLAEDIVLEFWIVNVDPDNELLVQDLPSYHSGYTCDLACDDGTTGGRYWHNLGILTGQERYVRLRNTYYYREEVDGPRSTIAEGWCGCAQLTVKQAIELADSMRRPGTLTVKLGGGVIKYYVWGDMEPRFREWEPELTVKIVETAGEARDGGTRPPSASAAARDSEEREE